MITANPITDPIGHRAEEILDDILQREVPRDEWANEAHASNWFTSASIRSEVASRVGKIIAEIDSQTRDAGGGR